MTGRHRGIVATLLVALCLGCLSLGGEQIRTERDLLRMIETSDTPEDHEALAAFYRAQAHAMEEKAALHEARAKRYARIPRGGGRAGRHRSQALAASHREMVAEYEALAELHAGHAIDLRGKRE